MSKVFQYLQPSSAAGDYVSTNQLSTHHFLMLHYPFMSGSPWAAFSIVEGKFFMQSCTPPLAPSKS